MQLKDKTLVVSLRTKGRVTVSYDLLQEVVAEDSPLYKRAVEARKQRPPVLQPVVPEAPPGVVGDFDAAREGLLETIIECDDALMERYFEGEEIGRQELMATLGKALSSGALVPVLCCAAKAGVGVKETLQFLAGAAPTPGQGPVRKAKDRDGTEVELKAALEAAPRLELPARHRILLAGWQPRRAACREELH